MAEPERRALGEGAAQAAPTAPHATPHAGKRKKSGPERFWANWPVRLALGASLVVSGLAHCSVVPLEMPKGFEVNDVEGEATIPVDLFEQVEAPPPPPLPPEDIKAPPEEPKGPGPTPVPVARHDAGALRDAGADALADAEPSDAAPPEGGTGLDGAVASAEAGITGPRDPQAIVGAAGDIQVDAVLVMVVINAEVIRKNPIGANMGFLLKGIPQWDQFMHGTDIDPVGDTDWVMISGPSLANTTRDVVLVHYSAPDAKVDKAMDVVASNFSKGGPYDAGVPTVKAVRTYADGSERIVMRPRSHVLAVVPPSAADKVARQLARSPVPAHIRKGEAVYLRLVNPHHPMPEMPESITELRMRVVPRDDDGADVFIDCDTKDSATASSAARDLRNLIDSRNTTIVSMMTGGLFDHVDVAPEGNLAKVHLTASREQIATLVRLVGSFLGVHPTAPGGSAASKTAPAGSR